MTDITLLASFGVGYVGSAVVAAMAAEGRPVVGVTRANFAEAGGAIATATHLLSTVPPDDAGDPVLLRHGEAIAAAPGLRWIGYISTTGVYGDRNVGSMRTPNLRLAPIAAVGALPPSRHGVFWPTVAPWICSGLQAFTVPAVRPSTVCVREPRGA